jgi:hypothetical protein
MEYNKIIAVTGLPGLYELLSSKSDGAIVRSLDDKSTRFVSSRIHNFSHLESIEVFTVRDNVNLVDILKAMEDSAAKLPDEKDGAALKAYFSKVYPDLDFGRVYSSDLKKMVKWFAVLKANEIEIKLSEPEDAEAVEVEEATTEKAAPPSKKAEKAEKEAKPLIAEKKEPTAEKKEPIPEKKEAAVEKKEAAAEKPKAKKPVTTAAATTAEAKKKAEKVEKAEKTEKTQKAAKSVKKEPAAEKPKKAAKKK